MAFTRKHYLSMNQTKFEDSPNKHLGGIWFVKKINNEEKFYLQKSNGVYQEMPKDCFEMTMKRSPEFLSEIILKNLKAFKEAHNGQN